MRQPVKVAAFYLCILHSLCQGTGEWCALGVSRGA